jgi:putative transposase
MTAPRQILPGTTWLVTRRCSEQRSFLVPSQVTREIFLYVLAAAAARHGMLVHAFCVMSNHYHLVVTDPGAVLPAFMRDLDSVVARATNAALGRWEGFWASQCSYSAVSPGATDDIVSKVAYVLANPVSAFLVEHGREWPGLWTAPEQLGVATFTAARPTTFFRPTGSTPACAELTLTVPLGFACPREFQERVAAELERLEAKARIEAAATRRGFAGRARVLARKPTARVAPGAPRRNLSPQVAARDTATRIEALLRLTAFRRAYREALAAFRAGIRDVIFPAGTYLLRVEHGVRCAALA